MRRFAAPLVAVLVSAAIVGLLVYGVAQRGDKRTLDDAIAKGERPPAPDRTLPALGAPGTHSLADYRGRVVVLNFWASWCPPCLHEAPLLERVQRSGTATVLGVTYEDTSDDALKFLRSHGVTYPNARDVNLKLAHEYGTRALPETFVIDPRGRVAAISRGELRRGWLERTIVAAERS